MATHASIPGSEFLDPAVLSRIGNLEFVARVVVEGFINGLHRSPHLGSSTDFAEHRPYMPGDDIRRIDWRVFARTDRFYVKEFEAETNTNFLAVLDVSPSMRYRGTSEGGPRVSKLEYGCFLAAALAYFSAGQRDRVGLATFDGDLVDYVPPSARHLQQVLYALDRANRAGTVRSPGETTAEGAAPRPPKPANPDAPIDQQPSGRTELLGPLRKLSESVRRRSIVLLISDLYQDPDQVFDAIDHLRGRGNDLICFHLLDRDEIEFPFDEAGNFIDVETGTRLPLIPGYLRQQYRALVQEHTTKLRDIARERRVDYARFDTSRPIADALYAYLGARERFNRVR
ncbi:MAG TPA: DUF58 domain-containing protein [Gemmatimonadaceae bacterium]|nr:DUF58 domain-containing protein [Gemmatimonadaceae bacterium]